MKIRILLCTIFVSHMVSAAQGLQSEDSRIIAKELANTVSQSLIEIQKIEAKYNGNVGLNQFSLSNRDASAISLGVLIDSDSNSVLAVTPNLIASEMGVIVGDKITDIKIDGVKVLPSSDAFAAAMNAGRELLINLERNGSEVTLVSDIGFRKSPEWTLSMTNSVPNENEYTSNFTNGECGYISQLGFSLRTKYLFETQILKIDDKHVTNKSLYRLSPGKHTIVLHEAIDDGDLLKFEDKTERRNYKSFEIIVEANKNHKIAAQYLKKNERVDTRKKNYWKPVIYKTQDRNCSF